MKFCFADQSLSNVFDGLDGVVLDRDSRRQFFTSALILFPSNETDQVKCHDVKIAFNYQSNVLVSLVSCWPDSVVYQMANAHQIFPIVSFFSIGPYII